MFIALTVLGIIGCFIALILLVALFTKKAYAIQRDIVINKPVGEVFDYLRHIKNQDMFSKWVMRDPEMKRTFTGNDGEVGFIYAWDSVSKQAGKGEQEITGIVEGKQIDLVVRFEKPMKAVASTPFFCEALSENQTRVTWGMNSKMSYPMNIMLLLMNMENLLGKDMDTSLNNLKTILESNLGSPASQDA
ncbi:MAG: SRPBCC family protein [Bacteroidota bacterium]